MPIHMKALDDRPPENYRRLKPITDRIVKLKAPEDLVSVAALVIGMLEGANQYEALRLIGNELREPIARWLRDNKPEESKIFLV